MAIMTVEQLYEHHIKSLSAAERLQLVGKIVQDLAVQFEEGEKSKSYDWMSLRGVAPNLLGGEDAQEWVSRTRREGDEQREKQWRQRR